MTNYEGIFDLLNDWRRLPKYQLERRADIFFAYYLPVIWNNLILKNDCGHETDYSHIIPEFPIKSDTDNTSCNIDFVIFCKDCDNVYYVELKTDEKSFDDEQLARMAEHLDVQKLIGDAKRIAKKSASDKYESLIDKISNIEKTEYTKPAKIYYIAPDYCTADCEVIIFKKIIEILEEYKKGDDLAKAFYGALSEWITQA